MESSFFLQSGGFCLAGADCDEQMSKRVAIFYISLLGGRWTFVATGINGQVASTI